MTGETDGGRDRIGAMARDGELFLLGVVLDCFDNPSGGVRASCRAGAEDWAEAAGGIPSFDPASSPTAGLDPPAWCRISPIWDETIPCSESVLFFPRVKMLRPKRRLEDSDR